MKTQSVQENYDRLADEYARHLFHELEHKPFDRQLLDRLASDLAGRGELCDMGCGPGQVARYLRDRGAEVSGLDLSLGMLEQARQLNPDIQFRQGDMLALDLPDGSFAGIAAFYAIVNIPPDSLPLALREMHRVLKLGGLLLLAFHVGEEIIRPPELWGQPVSMDFFFFPIKLIRQSLETVGFLIEDVVEREPYAPEVEHQSRRAYIFARKP
jgi:ubiquinone/menaquinone biosynthesis C-methylase UbiE